MEINEYIKLLENYSFKVDAFDRIVLANHEIEKDGSVSTTINDK